jgi:CheY-like chemotaxis protein
MYAEYLRSKGFSVTEVDSTDAGLSAAPAADLVVTAIRMPGTFDGIELVRRLRADERTRATPLIVLTACAFEPDQARAFAAGCDVFLPKPCLPEMLVEEARRLITDARRLSAGGRTARARSSVERRIAKTLVEASDALVKDAQRLTRRKRR